jgi:hydrogenase nickel incorporation protein HypA/HybF
MHELALALDVIDAATERCGGQPVKRVVLEIGKLSAVLPDALSFCFELAAEGSLVEGASLDILETPGSGRCRACGAVVAMEHPLARCACGVSDLEWLSGEELRIVEIELR